MTALKQSLQSLESRISQLLDEIPIGSDPALEGDLENARGSLRQAVRRIEQRSGDASFVPGTGVPEYPVMMTGSWRSTRR